MTEQQAGPGGRDWTRPLVWALIPYEIRGKQLTADTFDSEATKSELAATFAALGLPWVWQPVVPGSLDEVITQISSSLSHRPTIAFNFCDGLDCDGTPGLSVVKALEAAGIPFTGSDSRFYEISTSKVLMKSIFRDNGVETAPWEVLPADGPVQAVCERLGTQVIVKPDVSFASFGISLRSKVESDAAIAARRDEIRQKEMGGYLPDGPIFAERYLGGDEYTIFVGGYRDRPETIWNLPPAHRCFASSIPVEERFLTYDRYWGYYEEEEAPEGGEPFYHYELVEGDLMEELATLARRAYRAVDGYGYARVDIRRDTVNGKLSLLEVNANCGLSGDDQTSTGSILQLMGWDFPGLLLRLIRQSLDRLEPPIA